VVSQTDGQRMKRGLLKWRGLAAAMSWEWNMGVRIDDRGVRDDSSNRRAGGARRCSGGTPLETVRLVGC
jgi:hypothetical protein